MSDHNQWLEFAQRDLNDARLLYNGKSYSSAAYHCQQSTEKALKCFLVFKKQEVIKSHDLIKLCALCEKFDGDFKKLTEICELLTPFATKFRYPSEFDLPDANDAKLAIKQAGIVIKYVMEKISSPTTGQMEIR